MIVIEDILGRCAPLLGVDPAELRSRNFYRAGQTTPYGQPVRHPERIAAIWQQVLDGAEVARRQDEIGEFNRTHRARQTRAGHDAGQVRDLVQPDRVQPGRRPRARLQGRLGADQPRRHRDGPGAAHEDAAGRGYDARHPAAQGAAGSDAHRQGAQHVRDGRELAGPTSTAARSRMPANRSGLGSSRSRRSRSARTPPMCESSMASRGAWATRLGRCPGRTSSGPPTSSASNSLPPATTGPRGCTGTPRSCTGRPSSTSRTGWPRARSRSTASPARTARGGSTSSTTSETASPRWSTSARSRAASCRVPAGSLLKICDGIPGTGPVRGRLTTQAASTYKLPSFSEMPEVFNVTLLENATEEGAVYGSKAVGEPPLMLAFSVREALRAGRRGLRAARDERRPRVAGYARGRVLGGRAGPALPTNTAMSRRARLGPFHPSPSGLDRSGRSRNESRTRSAMPDQHWVESVRRLRAAREPGVLVTLATVSRPRTAGRRRQDGRRRRRYLGLDRRRKCRGRRDRSGAGAYRDAATTPELHGPSPCRTRRPTSTAFSAAAERSRCCSSRCP